LCALLLTASALATAADARRELRVCADPDNLPLSNERGEGFENKIAQLVADELDASLRFVWSPMSSATISQTLNTGKCSVLIGAPADWGPVLTTKPYYASTYVFIYRKNEHLTLHSFDDPALRKLKIGLPLISGGGANPPPAYALARRGLASNVVGFPMLPPNTIVEAVAKGEIDAAIVWGPLGGYFAKQQTIGLVVSPVTAVDDDSSLRFTYEMSMAVKRGDTSLKQELERVLDRKQKDIRKVLNDYGIPVVSLTESGTVSAKLTD
jgi:quinoprotein dehydrogenase-associated probable ABC transporter substrate-binding protein